MVFELCLFVGGCSWCLSCVCLWGLFVVFELCLFVEGCSWCLSCVCLLGPVRGVGVVFVCWGLFVVLELCLFVGAVHGV